MRKEICWGERKKIASLFRLLCLMTISGNLVAKERRGADVVIAKKDGQAAKGEPISVKEDYILLLDCSSRNDIRFHDLRHTFATRLVQGGVDIETVRALLGHHSIVMTQRYTHSSHELKQRAVEILAQKGLAQGPKTGEICDTGAKPGLCPAY